MPEPEPEPEPVREKSLTPAQKELAAINAKIAASPKKEPKKGFKYQDNTTHKIQRVATKDEQAVQEMEAINSKIKQKKQPSVINLVRETTRQTTRALSRRDSRGVRVEGVVEKRMKEVGTVMREATRRTMSRRTMSRHTMARGKSKRETDNSARGGLRRTLTSRLFGQSTVSDSTRLTSAPSKRDWQSEYDDDEQTTAAEPERWRPSHGAVPAAPADAPAADGQGFKEDAAKRATVGFSSDMEA